MGVTKKFGFAFRINELADILKAMGNPARLKIIQYLMANTSANATEILQVLPLAQSTVSKHLADLKRVKLLNSKIKGSAIYYSINEKTWNKFQDFLQSEINFELDTIN
jgi:DNA-binding transcriptional ArsR family regulator